MDIPQEIERLEEIKREISVRRFEPSDLSGVSSLIKAMHPEPVTRENVRSRSQDYYRWMYLKNPEGKAIVYCAVHNGKVVGNFAVAPKRIYCCGEERIIGKTMDMFMLQNYQGLGLMSKLAKSALSETVERGISSWYVTPSDMSYPIFVNRWNYIDTVRMRNRTYVIDPAALLKAYADNALIGIILQLPRMVYRAIDALLSVERKGYDVSRLHCFDKDTDGLWNNMKKTLRFAVCRDSKYLNWRYIENPDDYVVLGLSKARLLRGIIVLKETVRRGVRFGEIVDLLFADNERRLVRTMLGCGCRYLRGRGCAAVRTWSVDRSAEEHDYERARFVIRNREVKFLFSPEAKIEGFYNPKNWFLTQGDGNDL